MIKGYNLARVNLKLNLTENRDMIGKVGTSYMCGKHKTIAIQHKKDKTENSHGPSGLRLICEDCAGLND